MQLGDPKNECTQRENNRKLTIQNVQMKVLAGDIDNPVGTSGRIESHLIRILAR
jgi:ABC-type methionine transport system ATPase subunit